MKRTLLFLLLSLFVTSVASAQSATGSTEKFSLTYYTPDQDPLLNGLWVDDITFNSLKTTVSLHYSGYAKNVRLLPSTKLVLNLKGGKTYVLKASDAEGIPFGTEKIPVDGTVSFKAEFPPIPYDMLNKIKSFDFVESAGEDVLPVYFNVYDIKLRSKNIY